jgi:hypothetical protein
MILHYTYIVPLSHGHRIYVKAIKKPKISIMIDDPLLVKEELLPDI